MTPKHCGGSHTPQLALACGEGSGLACQTATSEEVNSVNAVKSPVVFRVSVITSSGEQFDLTDWLVM